MPATLINGMETQGAKSMELPVLKTASPVGRGARGSPGLSPDQGVAGPGQESVMAASASGAAAAWAAWAWALMSSSDW